MMQCTQRAGRRVHIEACMREKFCCIASMPATARTGQTTRKYQSICGNLGRARTGTVSIHLADVIAQASNVRKDVMAPHTLVSQSDHSQTQTSRSVLGMLLGDMTGHCALMDKGKRAHWAWQASKRSNRDVLMQGFHRIVVSEHMLEPTSSESINVHPGTRMWSKCVSTALRIDLLCREAR